MAEDRTPTWGKLKRKLQNDQPAISIGTRAFALAAMQHLEQKFPSINEKTVVTKKLVGMMRDYITGLDVATLANGFSQLFSSLTVIPGINLSLAEFMSKATPQLKEGDKVEDFVKNELAATLEFLNEVEKTLVF